MLAMVLERNLSAESVRAYKLEYLEHRNRLARLLSERVRGLDERAALHLTRVGVVILAGLWPFSNPTPAIIEANADPRLADAHRVSRGRMAAAMVSRRGPAAGGWRPPAPSPVSTAGPRRESMNEPGGHAEMSGGGQRDCGHRVRAV
jgi:hypothetical protein